MTTQSDDPMADGLDDDLPGATPRHTPEAAYMRAFLLRENGYDTLAKVREKLAAEGYVTRSGQPPATESTVMRWIRRGREMYARDHGADLDPLAERRTQANVRRRIIERILTEWEAGTLGDGTDPLYGLADLNQWLNALAKLVGANASTSLQVEHVGSDKVPPGVLPNAAAVLLASGNKIPTGADVHQTSMDRWASRIPDAARRAGAPDPPPREGNPDEPSR